MTSLKRRFAMSSLVLAVFALAGTTGLCAEDTSSVDYQKLAESRKEAAKTGNESGLSARIILPDVIKPVDGVFPAKLELTNNGERPVRVATLCQAWWSSSKGAFHVSLKPDRWKSDPPPADQSAKSVVELSPGESTTIPFEIVDGGGETLHVTASYGVLEEFARKSNVWSGFVRPVRVVLERVKQGELRLLPSDEFPLPSTQVSIKWAFSQPQVFAVVCEAVSDVRAFRFYDLPPDGVRGKSQVFKVTEVLAGKTAAADDATFDYFVLDRPGAHERTIGKGERVIWVARPWTEGDVGVKSRPHCLKVLRDTPENRRAVQVAHADRRALPKSRTPLEAAIRGGFAFVAACEALEDTQGEIGAIGKLNCTQEFQVHQLLAGDGPGVGKFRLHYTYGDVQECRERAVRKRERVIWIVREKAGDVPRWHGTKALPDTPQNRQTVVAALAKEQGKEVLPFLIELLQDPRKWRRYLAAEMLGGIGPEAKTAIPALIAALEDPERSVRALAAEALGKIGTDTELIVPALMKAEKDEDSLVRNYAERALQELRAGTEKPSNKLSDEERTSPSSVPPLRR